MRCWGQLLSFGDYSYHHWWLFNDDCFRGVFFQMLDGEAIYLTCAFTGRRRLQGWIQSNTAWAAWNNLRALKGHGVIKLILANKKLIWLIINLMWLIRRWWSWCGWWGDDSGWLRSKMMLTDRELWSEGQQPAATLWCWLSGDRSGTETTPTTVMSQWFWCGVKCKSQIIEPFQQVNPPSIKAGTNQFSKLTSPASISTSVRLDCQDERRSLFSTNSDPTSYQPTAINRHVEVRRAGESFYNLFPQTINFLLLTTLAPMMNITTFLCTDWKTRFNLSNRQSGQFYSSI